MMSEPERYSYQSKRNADGQNGTYPILPFELSSAERSIRVNGLLDTGSDVNVLPYSLGLALSLNWDKQPSLSLLSGNLARYEVRGVLLEGRVGNFPPVDFAFAWVATDYAPLLLGHLNFFQQFNVCFYAAQAIFEIRLQNT